MSRSKAGTAQLERLARYMTRQPFASERLALTEGGQIRYTLKAPYRDGTTHVILEPLDLSPGWWRGLVEAGYLETDPII